MDPEKPFESEGLKVQQQDKDVLTWFESVKSGGGRSPKVEEDDLQKSDMIRSWYRTRVLTVYEGTLSYFTDL